MKYLALFIALLSFNTLAFERYFIGAHSKKVFGSVEQGVLYTKNIDSARKEVRNQLKYLVGYLNEFDHGVDFTRAKFQIKTKELVNEETQTYKVTYRAEFDISWSDEVPLSSEVVYPFPTGGSYTRLTDFFNLYAGTCRKDRFPSPMSLKNFWYRIRRAKTNCVLAETVLNNGQQLEKNFEASLNLKVSMKFAPENAEIKYPEYDKMWEDDVLTVAMIFGKSKEEGIAEEDAGIRAYNKMYRGLIKNFSTPTENNIPADVKNPNTDHPFIQMTFHVDDSVIPPHIRGSIVGEEGEKKTLIVTMFLTSAIKHETLDFNKKFYEASINADLVSYNGHAGLGGNIDVFGRIGGIQPNKYQIYFANGCTTYSYFKNILNKRHSKANGGLAASKHLDIITNATPSYFSRNASNNLNLIKSFLFDRADYKTLLQRLDYRQMAIVNGEEDNVWTPQLD